MKYIHKIIFITILAIISISSYADTTGIKMCSANDAVTVVLDASINPKTSNGYTNISAWKATFDYGTIQGRSACLSFNNNNNYGNVYNGVLKENNKVVVGGERSGNSCWCRITHPVMSKWYYYYYNSGGTDACVANCANNCRDQMTSNYIEARRRMFNSAN